MKQKGYLKIIVTLFGLITTNTIISQTSAELAFSKSYSFEYDTQYAKAIESLTTLNSDAYEVSFRLGWLYYLSKDYAKSESFYKKAIAAEPASIEARFGIVLPLSALGNWNMVLTHYLDVLKLDPNNSIANYRTAYIYYSRKEYANAMVYVGKVIKMYPFDYDSNLLAAKVMMVQAKNAEAKKYFIKALEYNPQSEEAKTALKKL
ncbi:MAG: tetratricopeptide repeat protein [Bacteroidota bacterium]